MKETSKREIFTALVSVAEWFIFLFALAALILVISFVFHPSKFIQVPDIFFVPR